MISDSWHASAADSLGSALTLGVGLASWKNSAFAGVSEQSHVKAVPPLTNDARASGAIVVAERTTMAMATGTTRITGRAKMPTGTRTMTIGTAMAAATTVIGAVETTAMRTTTATGGKYGDKGDHDGNGDNGHWKSGNNDSWRMYGNKGDHDGNDDNGHWKGGNNDNWKKYGNKNDHDDDGIWSKNGYQHRSQNHKNYGNGWSGYNNNWNKNWDRRAYVRNWNSQPYYGDPSAASSLDRFWRPTV